MRPVVTRNTICTRLLKDPKKISIVRQERNERHVQMLNWLEKI